MWKRIRPRKEPSLASEARATSDARWVAHQAATLVAGVRGPGTALLLVSDFDGTLAELVADPWGAVILPDAQRALRRLAAAPGVSVALLSGRGVADLSGRARIGGISYLGDHGAEWAEAPRGFRLDALRVRREPASTADLAMAARLCQAVPRAVPEPWLVVEAKGPAVTFHFRSAPDVDAARARVTAAVAAVDAEGLLHRSGGRRSLELRPASATDKGRALRRLIELRRPHAVIMLGDDPTDVRAFDALREARSAGRIRGLAVAVAGHPDVSAIVAPQADLLLASPREAARFLRLLGARVAAPSPTAQSPTAAPAPRRRPRSSPGRPR